MPIFTYKAADAGGKVSKGILEASDQDEAVHLVRERGLLPIVINHRNVRFSFSVANSTMDYKELAYFCRQCAILFESGVSVTTALRVARSRRLRGRSQLRTALENLVTEIQSGESLSVAMERNKCFPKFLSGMTGVGEKTGDLAGIYNTLAGYYEKEAKRRGDTQSALLYPVIVFISIFFVIIIAVAYVVPSYAAIFLANGIALPAVTVFFMDMSGFFIRYGVHIAGIALATAVAFRVFLYTKPGGHFKGHFFLDAPFIKTIYRKTMNRRLAYVLYILLEAGVNVVTALAVADEVIANSALSPLFARIINETRGGSSLSRLVSEHAYFDPLLAGMLATGEETGTMPGAMLSCGNFLEQELDMMTTNLTKLIEPISILVLGIILAFIMLAIMLPTFSMGGMT